MVGAEADCVLRTYDHRTTVTRPRPASTRRLSLSDSNCISARAAPGPQRRPPQPHSRPTALREPPTYGTRCSRQSIARSLGRSGLRETKPSGAPARTAHQKGPNCICERQVSCPVRRVCAELQPSLCSIRDSGAYFPRGVDGICGTRSVHCAGDTSSGFDQLLDGRLGSGIAVNPGFETLKVEAYWCLICARPQSCSLRLVQRLASWTKSSRRPSKHGDSYMACLSASRTSVSTLWLGHEM